MNNTSLAAKAVASSPSASAPAAFNGVEWLVALNLWAMTAACLLACMAIYTLVTDGRKHRHRDVPGISPARLLRWIGLLFATGIALRSGAEALTLWGWDTTQPARTGTLLFIKRLVDPVAIACGVSGMALLIMSLPGMLSQLRREPLPIDIWQSWPIIRRMLGVAAVFFVAAVGVTVTR
ncbi:hypothetical protein [uncultured Sphingomonas sp.]|uniref:hypothetical protein n=1 Tax=uncultured Sphingomonas sp. TaxID=158754 RepID=UPI0026304B1F|nr:hypothetical protein [uncultured Sphingomonas sp.]